MAECRLAFNLSTKNCHLGDDQRLLMRSRVDHCWREHRAFLAESVLDEDLL